MIEYCWGNLMLPIILINNNYNTSQIFEEKDKFFLELNQINKFTLTVLVFLYNLLF